MLNTALVTAGLSWAGELCIYRVARDELPVADRYASALAAFFVPSVLFWGCGYNKEAIVVGGFGVLILGTYRLVKSVHLGYVVPIAFGAPARTAPSRSRVFLRVAPFGFSAVAIGRLSCTAVSSTGIAFPCSPGLDPARSAGITPAFR